MRHHCKHCAHSPRGGRLRHFYLAFPAAAAGKAASLLTFLGRKQLNAVCLAGTPACLAASQAQVLEEAALDLSLSAVEPAGIDKREVCG
jgi:hypothetical protein